jgi:hypothetical protein
LLFHQYPQRNSLIYFSHLDESVLRFLEEFQQNSLFVNVNLIIYENDWDALLAFITKFVPTSIHSIRILDSKVLLPIQNDYCELAMPMLTSTSVLIS